MVTRPSCISITTSPAAAVAAAGALAEALGAFGFSDRSQAASATSAAANRTRALNGLPLSVTLLLDPGPGLARPEGLEPPTL